MAGEIEARLARAKTDQAPATRAYVVSWAVGIVEKVTAAIRADREANKALARRLETAEESVASMEKRLAALESRQLRYVGTHETGRKYVRGEFVTHRGSLWHCDCDTVTSPGDSDSWTLTAKRGRDAR